MKILMVSAKYKPINDKPAGGIESVMLTMTNVLNKIGHEVHMSVPADSTINYDKLHLWSLPSKTTYADNDEKMPRNFMKVVFGNIDAYVKQHNIDLVILHDMSSSIIKLFKHYHRKVIAYVHNGPIYGLTSIGTGEAYKELIAAGGYVVAVSKYIMDAYNRAVPGCISDYQYLFYTEKSGIDKTIPVENYAMIACRLIEQKHPNISIYSAFKSNRNVVVAGEIPTNPEREIEFYNGHVKHLIEDSRTKYLGNIKHEEVLCLMSRALVFMEAEQYPALSLVAFEAASMGCPVIKVDDRFSGCIEVFNQINHPLLLKVNTTRKKWDAKVMETAAAIDTAATATMEDRESLAIATQEFFSVSNWEKRFNTVINNYSARV